MKKLIVASMVVLSSTFIQAEVGKYDTALLKAKIALWGAGAALAGITMPVPPIALLVHEQGWVGSKPSSTGKASIAGLVCLIGLAEWCLFDTARYCLRECLKNYALLKEKTTQGTK